MNVTLDPLRALERSPFFRGLPRSVLHGLSMFADERTFRAGELLIRQGEPVGAVLLVAAGEVVAGAEADRHGPGALLGHLDLVSGQPSAATWTAVSAGAALAFSAANFAQLRQDPGATGSAFRRALIISFADQLLAANQAVSAFVGANPRAAQPSRRLLDELSAVLAGTRGAGSSRG